MFLVFCLAILLHLSTQFILNGQDIDYYKLYQDKNGYYYLNITRKYDEGYYDYQRKESGITLLPTLTTNYTYLNVNQDSNSFSEVFLRVYIDKDSTDTEYEDYPGQIEDKIEAEGGEIEDVSTKRKEVFYKLILREGYYEEHFYSEGLVTHQSAQTTNDTIFYKHGISFKAESMGIIGLQRSEEQTSDFLATDFTILLKEDSARIMVGWDESITGYSEPIANITTGYKWDFTKKGLSVANDEISSLDFTLNFEFQTPYTWLPYELVKKIKEKISSYIPSSTITRNGFSYEFKIDDAKSEDDVISDLPTITLGDLQIPPQAYARKQDDTIQILFAGYRKRISEDGDDFPYINQESDTNTVILGSQFMKRYIVRFEHRGFDDDNDSEKQISYNVALYQRLVFQDDPFNLSGSDSQNKEIILLLFYVAIGLVILAIFWQFIRNRSKKQRRISMLLNQNEGLIEDNQQDSNYNSLDL